VDMNVIDSGTNNEKSGTVTALFGGAFDPFHLGHEAVIEEVLTLDFISDIVLLPTGLAHHKVLRAASADRVAMIQEWLAQKENDRIRLSEFEVNTPSPSYTLETVNHFQSKNPNTQFVWVMGMDSFFSFHNWHRWEKILSKIPFLIINRDDFDERAMKKYAFKYLDLPDLSAFTLHVMPEVDVSSSEIRRLLERGDDVRPYVPSSVAAYIEEKGLYR